MLRLRQACVHSELCKDYESQLESIVAVDGKAALDSTRASHLYNLIKDADEDSCCVCGKSGTPAFSAEEANSPLDVNPFVSKCGHLFCAPCTNFIKSQAPERECPLCQTLLSLRNDICQVDLELVEEREVSSNNYKVDAGASSKVKALVRDLRATKLSCEKNCIRPVKSIVFSQWTQVLDLIEGPLTTNEMQFARLDGSMTRPQRNAQLERFRTSNFCNVLLISIKAGGVGLNLTHASRVYIMEPYWNPAIEQQGLSQS